MCVCVTISVQGNLSNTGTYGTKILVLISEVSLFQGENNMWQSWIEFEYYSVAYFEDITEFDVL